MQDKATRPFIVVPQLKRCAACGCDHKEVLFKKMAQPDWENYTHWCACPVNGEPVFLKVK